MSDQPNWGLIDTEGPPDDIPTPQDVRFEESETLEPNASLEDDTVQDVKP